jgi:hypothetical protein
MGKIGVNLGFAGYARREEAARKMSIYVGG